MMTADEIKYSSNTDLLEPRPSWLAVRRNQTGYPSIVISISIVSHGQGDLVHEALADLARFSDSSRFEIILTRNISERLPFSGRIFHIP